MHTTLFSDLLADTQLGDQGTIALDILLHEIVEQAAALTDHLVQTAAGVIVLRVLLEVLGQLSDTLGEDGDLDFRRTGVSLVGAVGFDDSGLLVFEHHSVFPPFNNSPGTERRVGESSTSQVREYARTAHAGLS